MSNPVIRIESLSKRYVIGHQRGKGDGLRHAIEEAVRSPIRWLRGRRAERAGTTEEFWALKDVSFELEQGDVVGIIGRNGAGKSTLLKILSRITEPTSGRIEIGGRVASLLEVGTGFHQELTGRENIFLNGAILGMSRVEIRRKFDEIVAFSEVEKFLDTPVKRYSSGMYVRLAFAVAAHLEPEILIVDEVLAVGDAEFQKKCLGKMREVSKQEGRTVLFVSHNMEAVTRLCRSAVWLESGQVKEIGPATDICMSYFSQGTERESSRIWSDPEKLPGNEWVRLEGVEAISDGTIGKGFDIAHQVKISLTYRVLKSGKICIPNIHLYNDGGVVLVAHDWFSGWRDKPKPDGRYRTVFTIPGNFLAEGRHTVRAAISTYRPSEVHVDEVDAVNFIIVDNESGQTARGDYAGPLPGIVRPILDSTTEILR